MFAVIEIDEISTEESIAPGLWKGQVSFSMFAFSFSLTLTLIKINKLNKK